MIAFFSRTKNNPSSGNEIVDVEDFDLDLETIEEYLGLSDIMSLSDDDDTQTPVFALEKVMSDDDLKKWRSDWAIPESALSDEKSTKFLDLLSYMLPRGTPPLLKKFVVPIYLIYIRRFHAEGIRKAYGEHYKWVYYPCGHFDMPDNGWRASSDILLNNGKVVLYLKTRDGKSYPWVYLKMSIACDGSIGVFAARNFPADMAILVLNNQAEYIHPVPGTEAPTGAQLLTVPDLKRLYMTRTAKYRDAVQTAWGEFATTPEAKELLNSHLTFLRGIGAMK